MADHHALMSKVTTPESVHNNPVQDSTQQHSKPKQHEHKNNTDRSTDRWP